MDDRQSWAPQDAVEAEVAEFRQKQRDLIFGKITEDDFRQFRLERGVYGQRQPGVQMLRIKIPYGGLTPAQLGCIAQVAARHGHGIAHLTTRQDIQLHYVKLADIPSIMEQLADADITTREACGNSVRNVTACPYAGVSRDEVFDVTPHAHAVASHLMRNPSTAGMGRKFKISFAGSESSRGLLGIHDIGFLARLDPSNGSRRRGFAVVVGGGLGAAPRAAQLFSDFVPEDGIIPLALAITRVFSFHGERNRRMRARMKFLIQDIGVERFRELVTAELRGLPDTVPIEPLTTSAHPLVAGNGNTLLPSDEEWVASNVYYQRLEGFAAVTVRLTLGDIPAATLDQLARLAAEFTNDIRVTVDQNFLLRWVSVSRLRELYQQLNHLGLAESGAGRLIDITACPGADTCNLGITSSKGLARAITSELHDALQRFAQADLSIKISGCPNSCGQHHLADIGFYGCSIKIDGRVAPAFQLMLGGWSEGLGAGFAEPLMKFPSRRLPQVLTRLLEIVEEQRNDDEPFRVFVDRIGRDALKEQLAPLGDTADPEIFLDFGGHSEFALKVGQGECAGSDSDLVDAILNRADSLIADSERYRAETRFEESGYAAFSAVIQAAKAGLLIIDETATTNEGIVSKFASSMAENGNGFGDPADFRTQVMSIKSHVPTAESVDNYLTFARSVIANVRDRAAARTHTTTGASHS
jgi:sulfite reductase (ferredoxin)